MKQCFLHNLMMRSHCWSQFPFWVHPQCLKFPTKEQLLVVAAVVAAADAVVAVEAKSSHRQVFGISLEQHLFL